MQRAIDYLRADIGVVEHSLRTVGMTPDAYGGNIREFIRGVNWAISELEKAQKEADTPKINPPSMEELGAKMWESWQGVLREIKRRAAERDAAP